MSRIDRDGMIERMVESVDNWDIDSLVEFAKDMLAESYSNLCDSDLCELYDCMFNDDDVYVDEKKELQLPSVEMCPNCGKEKDIGQKCWWCGVYT